MAPWLLEGKTVALREYAPEDSQAVLAYAQDRDVTRYLPWGPEGTQEVDAFLARVAADALQQPRTQYEVAVVRKDTGALIGAGRLGILSAEHRRGDIGYVLRRDSWGQGIGSEVARLLVDWGFRSLGLHRIEATCDPRNHASRRVLEKLGMNCEGCRRDDFLSHGEWRDSLLFALLEDEWRA